MLNYRALFRYFGILTALAIAVVAVFPTSTTSTNTAEAQATGICGRTQAVQDALFMDATPTMAIPLAQLVET